MQLYLRHGPPLCLYSPKTLLIYDPSVPHAIRPFGLPKSCFSEGNAFPEVQPYRQTGQTAVIATIFLTSRQGPLSSLSSPQFLAPLSSERV